MKREGSKKVARRGRPAKPEGETLDAVIPAARCKSSEREAFEKASEKEGVTLTQWVRLVLNRAVEK
jgi:hypothetical protein